MDCGIITRSKAEAQFTMAKQGETPSTSVPVSLPSSSPSVPVHKWNLTYDGSTSVRDFIERIEELAQARNESQIGSIEKLKCLVEGQYGRAGTSREKDEGHNAVYYAIRSNNVELFDTLFMNLMKSVSPESLDQLVSVSLEELLLKNVPINDEMQLLVQSKLMKLRFYWKDNELPTTPDKDLIQQRLQLLQDNISTLTIEYSNKNVDSRFIYIAKFIAQNIHISKQVLKSTYSTVPWEEIEFCLVCFISAQTELKQINLFYLFVLRKDTLLKRLENFSQALCDLEGFLRSSEVSKLRSRVRSSREKVVAGIISKYPQFQDLYTDYEVVRDIYSLDIMNSYINAALPMDPATRDGQLTIKRTLQVLGEHLKDTLDSPNLSTAASDLLLSLAPKATRDILKDLRNSISHVHIIQDNDQKIEGSKLYSNILNDIKKIATVIIDITNINKINVFKQFFAKEFIDIECLEKILRNLKSKILIAERKYDFTTQEHQNIGDIVEEISRLVSDKTPFEEKILSDMKELNKAKIKGKTLREEYSKIINHLHSLHHIFQQSTCSRKRAEYLNFWRRIYFPANITICPAAEDNLQLTKLTTTFFESVKLKIHHETAQKISSLLLKILYLNRYAKHSINWIDEYRTQLSLHTHHDKDIIKGIEAHTKNIPLNEVLDERITQHLCELGEVIGTGRTHHTSRNLLPLVQKNNLNKLRVEALMLDTMSLLEERTKCLSNNWLYLDDDFPLLSGRVLRNYLAHGNPLVDSILSGNSFSVVILNTMILTEPDTEEILILNNCKMGKISMFNFKQLKQKCDRNLEIISKQEEMCKALLEGNPEHLQTCLREGADLYSRNIIDCSTTLHIAAKGTSVEMVRMLIENDVSTDLRDINGQNPLHIAAAFGRNAIVQYLVEEMSVSIDQFDITGKTPLHLAALNGHTETVVTLLSLGANANIKDCQWFTSLYYALTNNFMILVKVLLEVDTAATVNDGINVTPLHIAAGQGHADLVQYLLENRADVNAKSLPGRRPLHFAAISGHREVVINLIKHGAYVNFQETNGFTPLHWAVLHNHEDLVNILLKEGAFVDIVCKKTRNAPLHTAIINGHMKIVQIILENHPNVNAVNNDGLTPLLIAAERGNCDIVEFLLEAGAQLDYKNVDGFSALHISAMAGHNDVVTSLLERGFIVDARTAKQMTPLHLAAGKGHRETVDILLAAGADVSSVTDDGSTPLHMSAGFGHAAVSQSLIINGSDVNVTNKMNFAPLHVAAITSFKKTVQLLLKRGANVEEVCMNSKTALHLASSLGRSIIVKALIDGHADVHAVTESGDTALHLAVKGNHKAIVNLLLDNGAEINAVNNEHFSVLSSVAHNNSTEILKILLAKGADVNAGGGKALYAAVSAGHRSVVETLLKHKDLNIHIDVEGLTFLQSAAIEGYWHIGRALINKRVEIDSIGPDNLTALLLAVRGGYKEFVDVLLENGADANLTPDGMWSPLHLAATLDHPGIVESLLRSGAKHDALYKNHTPIELAILHNQLNNLICFFKHCDFEINARSNLKCSLLETAARVGNPDVVQFLLDQGADLNAINSTGFKAIHFAAVMGHVEIVKCFLERGMSIGDLGCDGATLLHIASLFGHASLAQYLIDKYADVNAVDMAGRQPIHYAAKKGHKELVIALLGNGAMYNIMDDNRKTPSELTSDGDVRELLVSVGQLFKAVKENALSKTKSLLKTIGKPIEAKNADNTSLLHLASRKGFQTMCDILLKNGANPNAVGKEGKTPLHFASDFSQLGIIVSLLQNGAVYNMESKNGKTPLHLATQENTIQLLTLVQYLFEKTEKCDKMVIRDIKKIGDIGIVKAVLRCRNMQGSTLVDVAIKNNFPEVNKLFDILQDQFSLNLKKVYDLVGLKKFTEALSILQELSTEREHLLGIDDPGSILLLEIKAGIFYKQLIVFDALSIFEEIFSKRRKTLGPNHKLSLWTRNQIAVALTWLERNHEAWEIFQEVITKQKETLGEDHMDLLLTETNAAQCLEALKKFDKALQMNYEVLEKFKKSGLFVTNPALTLTVRTNIASVLSVQGKLEEATSIIKEVCDDGKSIYGLNDGRTLRLQGCLANVLKGQGKNAEALKVYKEVYAIQKNVLGPNHADTLVTCTNIVGVYLSQGRLFNAHIVYRKGLEHRDPQYNRPEMLVLDATFKELKESITNGVIPTIDIYILESRCEMEIIEAASEGNVALVESLIRSGSDVNTADTDGRTPLHFAASRGHADIVMLLLKNGADATAASVKGNTALHTAALQGCMDSVGALLQTVKTVKARAYDDFINAKTVVGGASALHVASKKGLFDIVKCLLEHGAIYNSPDRSSGHTALQHSGSQAVTSLLELVQEMFDCAEKGEIPQISAEKQEYLLVVLASRDMQGRTPVEVARFHHHHSVVSFFESAQQTNITLVDSPSSVDQGVENIIKNL